MNKFVNAVVTDPRPTLTENGSPTFETSLNKNVDFFFQAGAMRGQDKSRLIALFEGAYNENSELAVRVALWLRDARGGAGERQIFRDLVLYIETNYRDVLTRVLAKIPELGRWDDLLVVTSESGRKFAIEMIAKALQDGNGLAAKWMPRKGIEAARLRAELGLSPKRYRKLLVNLTKVVETQMCAKKWDEIEYRKVPSLAAARYSKAFRKHDEARYLEYLEKVQKGEEKINAGAVFPYDVVKGMRFGATKETIVAQWNALPNFASDAKILPMVDVSGSMTSPAGTNGNVSCMDVAVSLGLYFAEKNTGEYQDTFLTFSGTPRLEHLKGDIVARYQQMSQSHWTMDTNLDAAFAEILRVATANKVPQEDMPEYVLVLSDMEFNGVYGSKPTSQRVLDQFKDAGYAAPKIVWWNIQSRHSNVPVGANENNMALVSGFSPSIAKSVLGGDLEQFTPMGVMLKAIMSDRYAF